MVVMGSLEGDVQSGVVHPQQGTMLSGVGDEILMLGGSLIALVLCLVALHVLSGRAAPIRIHPEQNAPVADARREMGVDEGIGMNAEMEQCPICLVGLTHPVETNCGHKFCAECILTYWQHDRWPNAANCAVCRRPVTLLLPSPSLQLPAAEELRRRVSDYNLRMSGQPRPLMHYLYDAPTLLRHLWRDLFTVRGLLLIHKLHIAIILLFLVLYFLLPFDIIPEGVVGLLGLVDDLLIMVGALVYITIIYRAHVANAGVA